MQTSSGCEVRALPTLAALRGFVLHTLCEHDLLDVDQTPMHEAVITRSGRSCGLFFHIEGPRLLKSYALWAGEENRVLFYDSNGSRFREVRLVESPDPQQLARRAA